MKTSVQTNLLGQRVLVTIGMDDAALKRSLEVGKSDSGIWARLNEQGTVVAVTHRSDGFYVAAQMDKGDVLEAYLKHLRIISLS